VSIAFTWDFATFRDRHLRNQRDMVRWRPVPEYDDPSPTLWQGRAAAQGRHLIRPPALGTLSEIQGLKMLRIRGVKSPGLLASQTGPLLACRTSSIGMAP
jgi:hypothetical protein